MEDKTSATNWANTLNLTAAQMASLLLLGYTYYYSGKHREARDIFEGIQVIDPANPYPPAVLGSIHQQEGKYEEAIACFTTSLRIYPEDVHSLVNRGECYLNIGKFPEAAEDLKTAIALDPDQKQPASNRARLLAALTVEGLKLASEQGIAAVQEAKRRIDEQLAL
jgi:tetratricopeptide (TPR) repeat protein